MQSPSLFAANSIREVLKDGEKRPEMEVATRRAGELRALVSRRLDSQLLHQAQGIFGRDFQYRIPPQQRTGQLGVIVFQYATDVRTRQMAARLAKLGGYFRNSKILTRFSAVPLGKQLVIAYSENSGDDRIVAALDRLESSFAKASADGVQWSESAGVVK